MKCKPEESFPDAQEPEPDYSCEPLNDLKLFFIRKRPVLQQIDNDAKFLCFITPPFLDTFQSMALNCAFRLLL
jgi:hypothetical protein